MGKRDLPAALRSRFTEVWVGEPAARSELAALAAAYLRDAVPNPPVDSIVDFYLAAKAEAVRTCLSSQWLINYWAQRCPAAVLSTCCMKVKVFTSCGSIALRITPRETTRSVASLQDATLTDGGGGKPGYSLRTLCRALVYTRAALPAYGLQRALYDGAAMAFLTQLAPGSAPKMEALLRTHLLPGVTNLKVGRSAYRACSYIEDVAFPMQAELTVHATKNQSSRMPATWRADTIT